VTSEQPAALRPVIPACPVEGRCSWWHHGYKHFPKQGITAKHTQHGPAKYTVPARTIGALETETIRSPSVKAGSHVNGRTEYLRDVGTVIGWDEGENASFSYAECSGGVTSGRAYHGRPMHESNQTARALLKGDAL
jgi:hypothetical protein